MNTRTLPGTDLELSVVGMGCWTIGGQYWGQVDDTDSIRAVRAAVEHGITWFDTAPLYGDGHADTVLARALGSHIHHVTIATKVGVRTDGVGPKGHDGHAHSDLRPEHILADCEASLRRLKEPIDLLQVHWPCEWGTPLSDTLGTLKDLQDRGWIRHFGLCNYDAPAVRQARAVSHLASLQTPYSLLRREFEAELRAACGPLPGSAGDALAVLAYEPLCRGLLTGKYRSPPRFGDDDMRGWDPRFAGAPFRHASAVAQDLVAIGRKLGVSASAVALGWVASRPGITAVIAGARTADQVRQNARAQALLDRARIWDVVERAMVRHGAPPR
ncbi:MAG: aldo/keto reductase [Oligoflexia bacterium]|nr:aldo/keto reductase [Oligoflexia bacterium]